MSSEFTSLIQQLMSNDNNVRTNAETVYKSARGQPDLLVSSLLQLLRQSPDKELKGFAAILLRPLVKKEGTDSLWELLTPPVKTLVTNELIAVIENEDEHSTLLKTSEVIAELASVLVPQNQWPELLPFMFRCIKSEQERHRESALNIFADLAVRMGDHFRPYFQILKDILSQGMCDPSSKVKVAALSATCNFLQVLDQPQERAQFQSFIPLMLNTIKDCIEQGDEDEVTEGLEFFTVLAEDETEFLKPHMGLVLESMLSFANIQTLEEGARHMAIEVILTIAESLHSALKKVQTYIPRFLTLLVNMLLTVDDIPADKWNASTEEEDDDDTTDYAIAEEGMDRIALALGTTLSPILFQMIPTLLSSAEWKQRYAGLMTLSIVGEGCVKSLTPYLPQVLGLVIPLFRDPHPRVRWAACNCVGQMATDFSPKFQEEYHSLVLPALVAVMDDNENPRVQSHASSAVINFCEECDAEILTPYLDGLLHKLILLLQSGKRIVQEQVVTAIAAIADCAEVNFSKYYDSFMPYLKSILMNAKDHKEYRMLRGKSVECISLIGVAVGKTRFMPDAQEVMMAMMQTQSSQLEADDPQLPFILQSWARICRCLGTDFLPYLSYVMPPLIAAASVKADPQVTSAELETEEQDGWDYVLLGDKKVGIHTSILEEKADALNMIYCYCDELKGAFFPWVEEVSKIAVPLVKFFFHETVRTAAVSLLSPLLRSVQDYFATAGAAVGADKIYMRNLWNYMFTHLNEAIEKEGDFDIMYEQLEVFVECLEVVGDNSLTEEQLGEITASIREIIISISEKRTDRTDRRKDPDFDTEEQEEQEIEEDKDGDVLAQVAESLGHIFKYHKTSYLPIFCRKPTAEEDEGDNPLSLLEHIIQLLQPTQSARDRQSALCVVDDLIEFCGSTAVPLIPQVIQPIIQYISDPDHSTRQSAVYGAGICAQHGGDQFLPHLPIVLQRLTALINDPESRSKDFVIATENAISAVGKIIEFHPNSINLGQVLTMWLGWLPVTQDDVESKVIYSQLCKFIELYSAHLFSGGFQLLPIIIKIFAAALGTELINPTITTRMVGILRQMQSQLPSEALQSAWSGVTPEHQLRLQTALQTQQI